MKALEDRIMSIMSDFRHRRLQWLVNNPKSIEEEEFPPHLSRHAEAVAIAEVSAKAVHAILKASREYDAKPV